MGICACLLDLHGRWRAIDGEDGASDDAGADGSDRSRWILAKMNLSKAQDV